MGAPRRDDERGARRGLEVLLRSREGGGWRHALAALGSGRHPGLSAKLLGEMVDGNLVPNQLQAWLAFGGLAQRLEQPALTARIVEAVIARFPGEPRVALLHASQLREAGKVDDARRILAGLDDATRISEDLRLSVAAEYDALGDPVAAAAVLARGPQDDQSYSLRASLLAKAEDKAALGKLYEALQRDSAKPDPQRRLLLGQTAEFLERYPDALQWYRSVPGGDQRWQARLRAAGVLHKLKRGDEVHMLTTGEFAVLKALVMNARQPLTRDKLMNLARGREWDALERSIDVQISRLRRMIEPDPSKPRYIQTVWGVGYVFVPDGTATK